MCVIAYVLVIYQFIIRLQLNLYNLNCVTYLTSSSVPIVYYYYLLHSSPPVL